MDHFRRRRCAGLHIRLELGQGMSVNRRHPGGYPGEHLINVLVGVSRYEEAEFDLKKKYIYKILSSMLLESEIEI